jgi:drug/metabolite transporter (DMT)-like permease
MLLAWHSQLAAVSTFISLFVPTCLDRYPGTRITFWSYLCGTVFLGLSSFYYVGDADAFAIKHDNYWYALAYAAVVSSCAAYLLITWANSQTSSVIVTSFWPLQVFFSALFSFFVFAEEFQLRQGIGAAIIIAGLFAVCYTQLKISEFEASLPQLHLNKASEDGR